MIITSICFGKKYEPILPHWIKRISTIHPNASIIIHRMPEVLSFPSNEVRRIYDYNTNTSMIRWSHEGEAFWDVVRLEKNLELLEQSGQPIIHCDLDIIVEKDLTPLIELGNDMVISRETWGDPLPFCSGFYILFPSGLALFRTILAQMKEKRYGTYGDQHTLREYILRENPTISSIYVDGFHHTIVSTNTIRICILDMNAIQRDPIRQERQFANHINVDNVGGSPTFIRFFYEPMKQLPKTCRCGKTHLGNREKCIHA